MYSLRGAGQPLQVLQACALQLFKHSAHLHGGWTQAFTLQLVCRRALHVDVWTSAREARQLSWSRATSDRRFKEALEAPFWTTLRLDITGRLWRALARPGALLAPLVSECVCCALKHGPSALHCSRVLSTHTNISLLHKAGPPGASQPVTPTAAAGTPAGAGAWQWLQKQGVTVTSICGLAVADTDAERLPVLLASLPALRSIHGLGAGSGLTLRPHPEADVAAAQDFLAGAARAVAHCSCLRRLHLIFDLADKPADRVSASFWQYLAKARALENLELIIRSSAADMHHGSATTNVSRVVAGLAGLSRLRKLTLEVPNVCEDAMLPACMSRLVQLTYLSLYGLRCAPGWARLPALEYLEFGSCVFARDGEQALPGMGALVALTSINLCNCRGLRALPTSLLHLTQLRSLAHWRTARGEPPAASLPASAPCFASLTDFNLAGLGLPDFPACVPAMTRLVCLDLRDNCFQRLPDAVSVLIALELLYLGRLSGHGEIGGALDARALGNLACFPNLFSLCFDHCSVLLCPSFQAAAAHTCLQKLELTTAYPACGPSCQAFLGFVSNLLRQGRADVLRVRDSVVQGAGQQDGQSFRDVLQAVGFALCDDDDDGAHVDAENEYASDAE
jgi:hypothetical protein